MSSQGANATKVSGYPFNKNSLRDGSDWTTYVKEANVYKTPKPLETQDPWIPYGTGYRLTYLKGRFNCTKCDGNITTGFSGFSSGKSRPAPGNSVVGPPVGI